VQNSALVKGSLPPTIRQRVNASASAQGRNLRASEAVALVYFLYIAVLASVHRLSRTVILAAWLIPLALGTLAAIERRYSRKWSNVLRDWAPLALILVGYWELDWFAVPAISGWDNLWIGFDRLLLNHFGLRDLIEVFGGAIPGTLEMVYLLLYTIPPVCMAAIYWNGARNRADRFLFTLFLGTFTAYALLPCFPTTSPRIAFPHEYLPHYASIWRSWNIFLLDHYDISTGVFPSGHVAVGFSCGFGLLRALPRKRWWWGAIFSAASLVFLATVYGRYHYAADGIASIGISAVAWRLSGVFDRHE
jgi:membrane-associated phospholipid phosphatase